MDDSGLYHRLAGVLSKISAFFRFLWGKRKALNSYMRGKYSSTTVGVCAAALCALLLMIMLFIPPYLGVAGDGSIAMTKVMNASGLAYLPKDADKVYNDYYIRTYQQLSPTEASRSAHVAFIKLAVLLDSLFTRDSLFDLRFLALLYGLLYIPAAGILIKEAASRVVYFSESVAVALLGVIVFADVSYITYFASFYPEALWYVLLLYAVAAAASFQEERKSNLAFLAVFTAAGVLLCLTRRQCAILGLLMAAFLLKQLVIKKALSWRLLTVVCSAVLIAACLYSQFELPDDFTQTNKLHAMTRGVLLQSENPEETLAQFGIDPRYSILTDISAYDYYPLVEGEGTVLKRDFLDRYNTFDVSIHYLKHPFSLVAMLDLSVKASMSVARSYCGNFEESTGMPKMAKSIFWSAFSIFKDRSAPKTIGFVAVLVIGYLSLLGRGLSLRKRRVRSRSVMLDLMVMLTVMGLAQAFLIIVKSGDAEMIRYGFFAGASIDLLIFFVLAELLHRLNILESGEAPEEMPPTAPERNKTDRKCRKA